MLEEYTRFDGLDEAIIGITSDGRLAYSYEKIVEIIANRGCMSLEEAIDFTEYNVVRTIPFMGDNKPIIIQKIVEVQG